MTIKAEVEKNLKLSDTLKALRDKCFSFANQCTTRLKNIFNSVRAMSEEANLSVEDIPEHLDVLRKKLMLLTKL
jgi:hypothetical protein